MDFLHENERIGNLVSKKPEYASLFETLGLDYCCKGNKTLKELCDERNLNVDEVMQTLRKASSLGSAVNWDQMSLKEIIEHIVGTYHTYLRQELPRIGQLLQKINTKHGHRYAYIAELQSVFEKMKNSLLEHMDEEENVVFPLILKLSLIGGAGQEELKIFLSSLDEDHLEIGNALEKIKELANGYTSPSGACMTHMVMLSSLARLEQNLHEHIHLENHVLFPRVTTQGLLL